MFINVRCQNRDAQRRFVSSDWLGHWVAFFGRCAGSVLKNQLRAPNSENVPDIKGFGMRNAITVEPNAVPRSKVDESKRANVRSPVKAEGSSGAIWFVEKNIARC